MEQNSPEWHAIRCGKTTASRIADLMAKPRVQGEGMRANYCTQLAVERLTGRPMATYQNGIMEEAHEWEPKARAFYSFRTDNAVQQVAFVPHPTIEMAGCSPDGLVGKTGLVEFKCPIQNTHARAILRGGDGIDAKYIKQMQFQMACTGREWCDYVSYNDDMPEKLRGRIIRVKRDAAMIAEIEEAVRAFNLEVEAMCRALAEKIDAL